MLQLLKKMKQIIQLGIPVTQGAFSDKVTTITKDFTDEPVA